MQCRYHENIFLLAMSKDWIDDLKLKKLFVILIDNIIND